MGSWIETCALSGLTISEDTAVVYLLLTERHNADAALFGVSSLWGVRSVPLFGKYEDCGRIRVDEGQEDIVSSIEKQFESDLVSAPQGDRAKILKIPARYPSACTFDNIDKWLADTGLQIWDEATGGAAERVTVRKTLIRRDVWEVFQEQAECAIPENYASWRSEFRKALRDKAGTGTNPHRLGVHNILTDYSVSPSPSVCLSNTWFSVLSKTFSDVLSEEGTGDPESPVFDRVWDLLLVEYTMEKVRKAWIPAGFEGRQSTNLVDNAVLYSRLAKMATEAEIKEQDDGE